jgi:hypothetical protein
MRRVVPIALAVLAAGCTLDVTQPENPVVAGTPTGWGMVGQATASTAKYLVGRTADAHGGATALALIGSDSLNVQFAGVGQPVRADNYRGKRVRFTAWVRSENVAGNLAGLWMRVDGPGATQAFDNSATHSIKGTSAWHQVEIILDVPADAIGITFGFLMRGQGFIAVDDMKWEVIPANGPTSDLQVGPTATTFDAAAFYSQLSRVAPENMDFER